MNAKTKRLTTTGILVALGVILTMIKIYQLPFGGAITLAVMVPVAIIGYMYGLRWGLFSGFVFSLIQMILGATMSQAFAGMYDSEHAVLSVFKIILMAFLDYIVAFTAIGSAGMFRNKIKNDTAALALGAGCACLLRFLAHFLSGWILWGSYAEWFFTDVMNNSFGSNILNSYSGQLLAIIYSAVYNGSFMVPELILTVIVCALLISVKPLKKIITNENA